ncbi:MAG TPA: glycosyltransferase family 2 protein [Solirubrobacteraceae bacterium]|nr:glycosyltransferase family 2 protein [Solirubrobacteraceae bacterium]
MAASIDVIVPAYNQWELTAGCLAGLARQTVAHQAIVVDDGSSDGTPARVREQFPDARVIELGENRGYTAAVNRGVAAGTGEYLVLLNNDVEPRPEFLERLVAPMRAVGGIGSVASLMLRPGQAAIDSLGVTADATLAGFARLQGRPTAEADASSPTLTGPEGTAGAYRRSAWEQVGGLDERICAYMEILDLALRLRSAGWACVAAPDAEGVHLGSRTYGQRSVRQRRLAGFSRGYLLRRYGVMRGRYALRALLTEALVVGADAASQRDLQALAGRLEGWRAARGLPRHARPLEGIERSITFARSLALRRAAVAQPVNRAAG